MVRSIIIGIGLYLTAICYNPALETAQAQGTPQFTEPGVVSYTFRHQFEEDVPGTLDLIKGMGLTNIEFSSLFGTTADELKAMLDERGLICTSFGVGYDALVNDTEQVIENARTLGAKYIRVAWIPHEAPFSIEDTKRAAADFNRAGKKIREAGLYFAYHNHGYEFRPYNNGTLFDYLVEHTDPEYVSFEIDLLWVAHPGADPVKLLKQYPNRFRLMHLKDLKKGANNDFSGSAPEEYDVRLGTGQIDFPAVMEAAKNTNIEYYYIEDESSEVVERVPKSFAFIKEVISSLE
ncbi:sugar phosphate isomerase/epimerase family protein [Halalkalibaculum sp. DA3122]|uniref:sugar phosphate isomerase/epimerase family protein n=1 Tax=unclassified Halalkalibaculum TaxID=2964617 RepID=UPI003754B743